MDLKFYRKICWACDEILKHSIKRKEVVAVPLLHVLREHPEWLKQYNFLLSKGESVSTSKGVHFRTRILDFLSALLFDSGMRTIRSQISNIKGCFLIVSHLTNISQCSQSQDEYFGNLPKDVQTKSGVKSILVLINHTAYSSKEISRRLIDRKYKVVVLPKSLGLFNELRILFQVLRMTFFRFLRFNSNDEVLNAIRHAISSPRVFLTAVTPLRIGRFIEMIVKDTEAKFLMTTYEGHSRERIIFSSARKSQKNIKCFGYQHSIINKYQYALKRNIGNDFDPDCIFSCGDVTFKTLKNSPRLKGVRIANLGSHKSVRLDRNKGEVGANPVFLFLPEGMESEYRIFFNFLMACSEKFPDFLFIWRSHPILDLRSLDFFKDSEIPENFVISSADFDEDVDKSDYGIYRGSTAIIRGSMRGLRPIYLEDNNDLNIDILHSINAPSVSTPGELKDINLAFSRARILEIEDFCSDYFSPYKIESLLAEI